MFSQKIKVEAKTTGSEKQDYIDRGKKIAQFILANVKGVHSDECYYALGADLISGQLISELYIQKKEDYLSILLSQNGLKLLESGVSAKDLIELDEKRLKLVIANASVFIEKTIIVQDIFEMEEQEKLWMLTELLTAKGLFFIKDEKRTITDHIDFYSKRESLVSDIEWTYENASKLSHLRR